MLITLYFSNSIDISIVKKKKLRMNVGKLLSFLQDYVKRQTRFVSCKPANVITSSIEAVAESMGLKVHSRNYKVTTRFYFYLVYLKNPQKNIFLKLSLTFSSLVIHVPLVFFFYHSVIHQNVLM